MTDWANSYIHGFIHTYANIAHTTRVAKVKWKVSPWCVCENCEKRIWSRKCSVCPFPTPHFFMSICIYIFFGAAHLVCARDFWFFSSPIFIYFLFASQIFPPFTWRTEIE